MSRRVVAALPAAAAALALSAAGCATESDEPTTARPAPTAAASPTSPAAAPPAAEALPALLTRRARALERGDAGAYAATATGDQRRRDRRTARNAGELELRGVRLVAEGVQADGRRATLRVRTSYRLAGLAGRWSAVARMQARRVGRAWRITDASSRPPRPPWEVARYRSRRTPHFVVLSPQGVDPRDENLPETLERAYAVMRKRLPGSHLRRRYLVLVAAGPAEARQLTGPLRGIDQLTAVTDVSVRSTGPAERVTRVVAMRVLVPWARFSLLTADARLRVISHELTHAALARRTSGRTPAWLQEGIALYVSGDRRTQVAARALTGAGTGGGRAPTLAALSRPDAIGRLDGSGLSAAYAYSSAAAFYIASRYGEQRLLALLDAFGDEALSGRAGRGLADAATRRTLGVELSRLERRLRRWLRASG